MYVAGRNLGIVQNKTKDQAQQYLQSYIQKNRIPRGRAYMKSEGNDTIVRL